jgi:hypothetical protein
MGIRGKLSLTFKNKAFVLGRVGGGIVHSCGMPLLFCDFLFVLFLFLWFVWCYFSSLFS